MKCPKKATPPVSSSSPSGFLILRRIIRWRSLKAGAFDFTIVLTIRKLFIITNAHSLREREPKADEGVSCNYDSYS
jgi:hypothetical protein